MIWQQKLNLPASNQRFIFALLQIAVEDQSDELAPDMEDAYKVDAAIEFLHSEKITLTDIN